MRDVDQHDARVETERLIRRGEIIPTPCIACGLPRVDVHHRDYGNPRDIWFLCRRHHAGVHYGVKTDDLRACLRESMDAYGSAADITRLIGAPRGSVARFLAGRPLTRTLAGALLREYPGYLRPVLAALIAGGEGGLAA